MALLDVYLPEGRTVLDLGELPDGDAGFADFMIGRSPELWLSVPHDANVSRLHAKLSPVAGRWALQDVGSRNGTWVNGERLVGMRILRHNDEIRVGGTRMLFRDLAADFESTTTPRGAPPDVTKRERQVLVELCRPFFSANLVKKAAPRKSIAPALFIGEAAVQAHLTTLYRKFDIAEECTDKRDLLAVAVIEAGIVGPGDYEPDARDTTE